jgi:hypothetical protein
MLRATVALLELSATDVAVIVAVQLLASATGGTYIAVDPAAVNAPQPVSGLMVHVTPPLKGSFVTEAVKLTAEVPANMVPEEPD